MKGLKPSTLSGFIFISDIGQSLSFSLSNCSTKMILKTPTVGVEPTTFGLEVQRASPLRHAGLGFG